MSATSADGGEKNGNETERASDKQQIHSNSRPDPQSNDLDEEKEDALKRHLNNEEHLERDLELHEEEQDMEGGLTLRREAEEGTPLEADAQRHSLLSVIVKYPKEVTRLMACGTLSADAAAELLGLFFEQMSGCPVDYLTASALTLSLRRYATRLQALPLGDALIANEEVVSSVGAPLFICMERVLLTTTQDEQRLELDGQHELTGIWFCQADTMSLANGGKLTGAILPIAVYYPVQGEQTGMAFTSGERSMVLPKLRALNLIVPREALAAGQHDQIIYVILECLVTASLTSKETRRFSLKETRVLTPSATQAAQVVVVRSLSSQDRQ